MANVKRLNYLKINLKDEPGSLLKIMEELKEKNISLKALWGYGKANGEAEVFAIPKDATKLKNIWASMLVEEGEVFFIKGTDKTGALLKPLKALADENINIRAIHALVVGDKYGSVIWVNSSDVDKTAKILGAK